jgi:hypothetical protein
MRPGITVMANWKEYGGLRSIARVTSYSSGAEIFDVGI